MEDRYRYHTPLWERVAFTLIRNPWVFSGILFLCLFGGLYLVARGARAPYDQCARAGGVITYSESGPRSCTPRSSTSPGGRP